MEHTHINVNEPERWVSVIVGTALAAYGLKRRSLPSMVMAAFGGALVWRGATGHCFVYNALGVTSAGEDDENSQVSVPYGRGTRVEQSVTVNAPSDVLYNFWRDFENLPRIMSHLKSVTVRDSKRSHWVAKGPAGSDAEWDAEIINEIPGELIGWRSVDDSLISNAGSVHFDRSATGRGTDVRVLLRYDPPAGTLGARVAKLLGEDPDQQVREDLETFKQLAESGSLSNAAATVAAFPRK
jgi:uncharacterized membrane protein